MKFQTVPADRPSEQPLARFLALRSDDFEEADVALIAPARPTAMLGPAAQLFIGDHRQDCLQPLVGGGEDRPLVVFPDFDKRLTSIDPGP
jgi:hypothetical protein